MTTVLLADDEATTLRLLEAALARHGYATRSVTDGTQAWAELQQPDAPSIAVLDWNMPGLDGPEICRRVRQLEGRPYTYLILITARADVDSMIAGREAGADDFIAKPVHPQDLHARLQVGERITSMERKLAAQLQRQRLLHSVAQAMAEARSAKEAIEYILRILCEEFHWEHGSLWGGDAETRVLRMVEAYTDSSPGLAEFAALAQRGLKMEGVQLLPGRVWASCQPQWSHGVPPETAGMHPLGAAALRAGLRTGCGVPLMVERELLGVLSLAGKKSQPRDEEFLQLLAQIGRELAYFLERIRSEEALRVSEARVRAVVENMPTGLLILNEEGRIEAANAAAERIFGYSRDELMGQSIVMLMTESAGEHGRLLENDRSLEPGRIWEWEGRRKSGQVFPFELALYELPVKQGRGFAAKIRDISERREVDRLKNEFISTVSHELRTPLTAILGSLSLLQNGVVGSVDTPARELIHMAHSNAERLIRLVNDILDIEKIEAGRLELALAELDPAHVVGTTLAGIRATAQTAGIQLSIEVGTPLKGWGDFGRIVQVLTNLVSNAIKFSPAGGTVFTRVEETAGRRIRFSVTDQGRGIPADQLHRLFGRFQQLDAADTRAKGGTGLGLAISKALVELHRGRIGVESQVGHGTTFWFELSTSELGS